MVGQTCTAPSGILTSSSRPAPSGGNHLRRHQTVCTQVPTISVRAGNTAVMQLMIAETVCFNPRLLVPMAASELRRAVRALTARGLRSSASWAAEQLIGLPSSGDIPTASATSANDDEDMRPVEEGVRKHDQTRE
eukprot:3826185-Pleurochrysis_carterae.AAC.1